MLEKSYKISFILRHPIAITILPEYKTVPEYTFYTPAVYTPALPKFAKEVPENRYDYTLPHFR